MHESVKKYNNIVNSIKLELEGQKNIIFPKIIAVSKTFQLERIIPLIEYGHLDSFLMLLVHILTLLQFQTKLQIMVVMLFWV